MAAELEFILGRACSGKTHALFDRVQAIAGAGAECYIIVADQATFETERELAERLGGGLFYCGVYSWSSLARNVLDGLGERRAYLAPQGKVMLTRRAADACAAKLKVFGRAVNYKGFPAECDEIFRRFKRCGVTPEALAGAADKMPEGTLPAKLKDFALIYGECERLMAERYIDPEDMMNALCERMEGSPLEGAHVFIDGGDTVNEQGYRVFARMLACCKSVTVALAYDDGSRDSALFAPERRVLERMADVAHELGIKYKTTILGNEANGRAPALVHLERELFAHPRRVWQGVPAGLEGYIARDRMDEAAEAAENIRRAAANGMRYRDMAVVVSDLACYAPVIARVFISYGIPYFTDAKRTAAAYPLAELILASLTAAEKGFDADSILRVVKSGYCDITREQAEVFENYLIATGFYGTKLKEPFPEGAPADAEAARAAVMEPLIRFKDALRTGTAAERSRALWQHLEALDVYSKQKALCERLHAEGRFKQEEENAQVLNIVTELLDQLYVILGEGEIGLTRFISVVREGLASYELGVIPTTCDQVLVGNIGRTRARRVKLLQVLGMNEGLFPKRRMDDGVIDDADLKKLSEAGLPIWQTNQMLCESDNYDIYSALSKPSERLILSYPVNAEGESALPCSLYSAIRRIFPQMHVEDGVTHPRLRVGSGMALRSMALKIRRMADSGAPDPDAAPLYAYFSRRTELRSALDNIEDICFFGSSPAPFGEAAAKRLYGSAIYGSASRLETYNRCPFFHFMRYGIGAKEREEHKEKNTDVGTFYHAALEAYTRYVADNELDWAELTDERIYEILRTVMPPLMAEYKGGILYETARQRARLVGMLDTIRTTCCAMTRQIARGKFRPSGSEVRFGTAEAAFPPLKITLENGVTFYIGGIIDRIDTFNEQASNGVSAAHSRIIDYKTGGKGFDFAELAAGLQLQLPLYAAAVAAAEAAGASAGLNAAANAMPEGGALAGRGRFGDTVGMYYMPIKDMPPDEAASEGEKAFREELMDDFRLSGVSLRDAEIIAATDTFDKRSSVISARYDKNGDITGTGMVDRAEYDLVIEDAKRIAAKTLQSIMQGHAEVSPYRRGASGKNACRYCPYSSVCRFDPDPGSDKYRRIGYLGADGYFERR